ncbi:MAG: vitamin K epoxide reductase family protein [Gammaproteobacteria bacterium]
MQIDSNTSANRASSNAPAMGVEFFAPLLCLAGLCISAFLTFMHYALMMGDLSLGKACGGAEWIDCNGVIASRFGVFLGLPLSLWGAWFYISLGAITIAIVLLRARDVTPFVRLFLWLTVGALLVDAYLAWAMLFRLERLCSLCVATYLINVGLLVIALRSRWKHRLSDSSLGALLPKWAVIANPAHMDYYRDVLKVFLAGLTGVALLLVLAVGIVSSRAVRYNQEERLASLLEYLGEIEPFEIPLGGRPSRGPDDAVITIAVFSDFLCQQCRLAHEYLDIVAANHRDSLRVVYFHYPLDTNCNEHVDTNQHPGACELAYGSYCAMQQGAFWEYHGAVFGDTQTLKPARLGECARLAGLNIDEFNQCLKNPKTWDAIRGDIAVANDVGVTVTPTLYINGRPIVGALEPWMLEAAIERVQTLTAR